MTTKTIKKESTFKKLDQLKSTVKKVNTVIIDSSFDAIKTTIKNGEKWQKLSKKLVKKSEPLRNKQAQMLDETTGAIKEQFESGTGRLKTLVGYDPKVLEELKEKVAKTPIAKEAKKASKKASKKAKKASKKLKKDLKDSFTDVKDKFEDVAEEVKHSLEDTSEKIESVVEHTVKDVKKTFGETKKDSKHTKKDDLKIIHTVGPKMESVLNKNGVFTYSALAKTSLKKLEAMLEKANINAKTYSFSDWKAQAKLAAKGDMKGVSQLIEEIKLKK